MKKRYFKLITNIIMSAIILSVVLSAIALLTNRIATKSQNHNLNSSDKSKCEHQYEVSDDIFMGYKKPIAPYSDTVVCETKLSAGVDFQDNKMTMDSGPTKNPISVTIIDIESETPSIIGNTGDRVPLTKIARSNAHVYLFEETGFGNINVWTLFRDKNILLLSKQYDLLNISPFGLLEMYECKSG